MPVPPTMATNCPGLTWKLMWESTSSPLPEATYLKETSRNSTSPLGAGRTWSVPSATSPGRAARQISPSGLFSTEGSVSSTSLMRWAQA